MVSFFLFCATGLRCMRCGAGINVLVTDRPGCVMQLREGLDKRGARIEVKHIAELLAGQSLKKKP